MPAPKPRVKYFLQNLLVGVSRISTSPAAAGGRKPCRVSRSGGLRTAAPVQSAWRAGYLQADSTTAGFRRRCCVCCRRYAANLTPAATAETGTAIPRHDSTRDLPPFAALVGGRLQVSCRQAEQQA